MSTASGLSLHEIHVTRSTGLSLNERFTKITKNKLAKIENEKNSLRLLDPETSVANRKLLQQLQRKHKLEAALKLKRKSLRRFGNSGGQLIRRGTVKALRVGANGKPVRMNSLTNIATMKADHEVTNGRKSMRRSNSSSSLTGRLGPRRPSVGGAAERVARRHLQRQATLRGGRSDLYMSNNNIITASENRRRSRSRSRSRSRIRGSGRVQTKRGRSRSVGRNNSNNYNANTTNNRRSRSRTRNRPSPARNNVPIKARLGVRTGTFRNDKNSNNTNTNNNNTNKNKNRRNASLTKRGVIRGRIQKAVPKNIRATGGRGRNDRRRGRSAARNMLNNGNVLRARSRSQSRARKNQGQVGQQIQKQRQQQNNGRRQGRVRGRNQQRRSNSAKRTTNNNSQNSQIRKRQQQQQQRQNRSRSRSRNRINRGNNSQANQTSINKDDLDKELDQYMATTKTENNVDYLLKH